MDEVRPKRDRNRTHTFVGIQTYEKMQRRFIRMGARLKAIGDELTESEIGKLFSEEAFKDFQKRFSHLRNDLRKLTHGCASFIRRCKKEAENETKQS